jgi:ribulose-phosphate 3-epimerase
MKPSICPTVTAENAHTYRAQIERVAAFAPRIHIDVSDGVLAPTKLLELDKVWWPGGVRADIHVMLEDPFAHVALYRALGPQMVIVHAEAEGDFVEFAETMHRHGIETGVALLQDTSVDMIVPAIALIDHVLIFSGKLGYFGGTADLGLLEKVRQLRALKPTLEIGWDGGINADNIRALADGGVDVLNVGGFIQRAPDGQAAYDQLSRAILV